LVVAGSFFLLCIAACGVSANPNDLLSHLVVFKDILDDSCQVTAFGALKSQEYPEGNPEGLTQVMDS
jgi:hypothetical protein